MKFRDIANLSNIELEIFSQMKQYISHYKSLNLGEILTYCYKNLYDSYSKEEVERGIKNLIEKRYFLGERFFLNPDLLENDIRKRILCFIQKNPGAYNRLIRDKLNLHSNEFEWHTKMLEKYGFIKKILLNKRQYGYFENKSYMDHEYDLFLLQNDKVQAILDYLEDYEEASISKMAEDLRMHYSTIKKYINTLLERELIYSCSKGAGRGKYYCLNDQLMTKLKKIVNGQAFIDFAEAPFTA